LADVKLFHASTKLENGLVVTDGGRALGVTALGDTLAGPLQRFLWPGLAPIRLPPSIFSPTLYHPCADAADASSANAMRTYFFARKM
jgi:hypothetical protein